MEIEIISFGKIAEFISNQQLEVAEVEDTVQLQRYLESKFPKLQHIKYKLALNQTLVQEQTAIKNGDVVALMPPFSGG